MLSDILFRLRALFRRRAVEAELDDELVSHFEQQVEKYVASGMTRGEARRRARMEFGGVDQIKEQCREARGVHFLETLFQDVRFAFRMLRKSPGFTAVAILTLALGIGANTAIFTLLDGLVLRDLPVSHPEQLVHLGAHAPDDPYALLSLPMFQEISRNQKVFSGMFAWWGDGIWNVETNGQHSRADIWAVTGNFYSELGAVPEIGRLIGPSDVNLNAASPIQVAVLSYGFWQRNYRGAKDAIGKTIKIEDTPFTIIGVVRKGFNGMSADSEAEVTVPLTAEPIIAGDADVQKHLQRRDVLWLDGGGRLKPGVTLDQARAQIESLWPTIRQAVMPIQPTEAMRNWFSSLQMKVESDATGSSFVRGQFAKPVYVLLAISGVVLLIACVNLASLMISRAAARNHEFGVRVALGASPGRLARQMLTESIMLSVLGTLAGFALAYWGAHALTVFILGQIYDIVPATLHLSPDVRVLGFAAAVAIFTGVLFGISPAWRAAREHPNSTLQQNSRTVGRGAASLGRGLIVTQVVLSLVLLMGAALFVRTLEKLHSVQPGFRISGVLEADLFVKPHAFKNADRATYFRELTNRIASLPGVTSAGLEHMAVGNFLVVWTEKIHIHGQNGADFPANCEMAMPGFFRTENISLLRGRAFVWSDAPKAPRVAIVSENFAKSAFPDANAIGQRIDITTEPKWQNLEIVGIVGNASLYDIRKPPQPTVYLPTLQYGEYADDDELLIRTDISSAALAPAILRIVDSLGRHTVMSVKPVAETINRSILQQRITAMLSTFFGALALLIAGIGLFGLMAYSVTRRTRELGIRMALGAQRSSVLRMILRETLALTLIGIAIGIPCALAATRLIAHMLFGVTPYDPVTLCVVAITLLAVGTIAGYLPARRAMRVDPMVALRYE